MLDCCFSRRVVRHDDPNYTGIRAIYYHSVGDAVGLQNLGKDFGHKLDSSIMCDTRMISLPKWLVDPRGYMIFTACGPHEIAEEDCT